MPTIFESLEAVHRDILKEFSQYQEVDEGHRFSWPNYVFAGKNFRRAHLDIVDARDTKKLYMLHLTVMPHVNDPSPIFGFDIIAGPNKVTGAFHDFSPVVSKHHLLETFANRASFYEWSKTRELPDWAKAIFSEHMIAAGNIQTEAELTRLLTLVINNLRHYLTSVGEKSSADYSDRHNRYCHYQKQNPHTPKVMAALGLDPEEVSRFIEECLFPELVLA